MTKTLIALALFTASNVALADSESQCRAFTQARYPDAQHAPVPKGCRSVGLYYGIDGPVDHVRARQCALAGTSNDQPFQEDRGVLMMIYANGLGVPRDYRLAKKAACEAGGAPAEVAGRLAHLADMEAGRKGGNPRIDVCDDATSGYMGGWCASVANDLKEQKDGAAFAKLTARWSARERQAFATLQQQAARFIDLRSGKEVDLSGTLRAAFTIEEQARQRDDLRASVAAFERGALPKASDAEFRRLDARLNAVYATLRSRPAERGTTIRFAGIQQTQRAWLDYREAWVAFGKVKYPRVPANAWRAYFTARRIAMLAQL